MTNLKINKLTFTNFNVLLQNIMSVMPSPSPTVKRTSISRHSNNEGKLNVKYKKLQKRLHKSKQIINANCSISIQCEAKGNEPIAAAAFEK